MTGIEWRAEQPAGPGEPFVVRSYFNDAPSYMVAQNLPIEDARLISAAPDMQAALADLLLAAMMNCDTNDASVLAVMERANAALQKSRSDG